MQSRREAATRASTTRAATPPATSTTGTFSEGEGDREGLSGGGMEEGREGGRQ